MIASMEAKNFKVILHPKGCNDSTNDGGIAHSERRVDAIGSQAPDDGFDELVKSLVRFITVEEASWSWRKTTRFYARQRAA